MTLQEFNQAGNEEKRNLLFACCPSDNWINGLELSTAFKSMHEFLAKCNYSWFHFCGEKEWLEVFGSHPKIGEKEQNSENPNELSGWSAVEQSSVINAGPAYMKEMKELNAQYLDRHGFLFLVSAEGKPRTYLKQLIKLRLLNQTAEEVVIAAREQFKITVKRLTKVLEIGRERIDLSSHITTHILDLTKGRPATHIPVRLKENIGGTSKTIGISITDEDGRIGDLLPPCLRLKNGTYTIEFETREYNEFYPKVSVEFVLSGEEHYHIPLLLSQYGYSTYRGS